MDHDCTLNDRFGKPSCMTEFEQEIREDERERAVQRVEALPIPLDEDRSLVMDRIAVINAIKGDQP
jgi:hypothetical protein